MLVPESDLKGATQLANRLRLAISKARAELPDGRLLKATASFGVAVKGDLASAEQLIAAADDALYEAKRAGQEPCCRARDRRSRGCGKDRHTQGEDVRAEEEGSCQNPE